MNDLLHLPALEPEGQPRDGAIEAGRVRAGAEVDIPAGPSDVPEPCCGERGRDRKAAGVVCQAAIRVTVPIRTVSGLNVREHWRARAARVRKERETTAWILAGKKPPELPCTVSLTRVGPSNGLDEGDNLNSAFKGVRDQIAKWIGIDDRSKLVTWHYAQRREKKWSVEVEIS